MPRRIGCNDVRHERIHKISGIKILLKLKKIFNKTRENLIERYDSTVDTIFPGIELVTDTSVFQDNTDCVLNVPTYRQFKSYTCGFTAAAMIVRTFHRKKSIQSIWENVTPNKETGVSTEKLIRGLRKMKVGVKLKHKLNFYDVCKFIEDGNPIAVTVKKDKGVNHWVVIYGVNRENNEVLIAGNGSVPHINTHRYKWSKFKKIESVHREFLVCWGKY